MKGLQVTLVSKILSQASAWHPKTGRPIERWSHLDNFWKKHNRALLDKLFLERERERLEKENGALQVSEPIESCEKELWRIPPCTHHQLSP